MVVAVTRSRLSIFVINRLKAALDAHETVNS